MAFPWAAAIQAGSGIGGTILAQRANKKAWQRQVKTEQAIWERDTAYNEQYNSPQAQMERLKAAGLNPNLMYGQGTVGNVDARGSVPKAESFMSGSEPFMMMAANAFTDGLMFAVEMRKRNKEVDLLDTKIEGEKISQEQMTQAIKIAELEYPEVIQRLRRENRIGKATEGFQAAMGQTEWEAAVAKLSLLLKQRDLLDQDGKIKAEVIRTKEGMNDILEIQRDFLRDGDISPGQILKLISLVLIGKSL